jgi:hypothetical protein
VLGGKVPVKALTGTVTLSIASFNSRKSQTRGKAFRAQPERTGDLYVPDRDLPDGRMPASSSQNAGAPITIRATEGAQRRK